MSYTIILQGLSSTTDVIDALWMYKMIGTKLIISMKTMNFKLVELIN